MAKFSKYALWRLRTRAISVQEVEKVLADADVTYASSTSNRHCYVKEVNKRRIKVVVESFDHEQVVTAYVQDERK